MNQQDKERLRELAEKATPGPWHSVSRGQYWGEEEGEVHHADGQEVDGAEFVKPIGDVATTRGQAWLRDTDYIAAANPAAILAILEENGRLAAKARRYDYLCAPMANDGAWHDDKPYVTCHPQGDYYSPNPVFGTAVDEAVDAAMAKQGEK